MPILFFEEDAEFKLEKEEKIKSWIVRVSEDQGYQILGLNYIFCSDEYLLGINKEYLNHDYYTDIITFDNSEEKGRLEADIFISIERVRSNANTQKTLFENELHRVIIHGILHLMGYKDKTPEEAIIMREKEDACLSLLEKMSST